jgi:hypothetical protein
MSDRKKKPGRVRGKDSERSRSPSRQRASRGAKKNKSMGDMSIEEMVRTLLEPYWICKD